MFEKATRDKIRFSYKGQISVEDLWDLPLKALDGIYSKLSAEKKASADDSLLKKVSTGDRARNLKIDIVKHIVTTRLDEDEKKLQRAEKKMQKDKIASIIAKKQDASLENMSIEDLKKMQEDL